LTACPSRALTGHMTARLCGSPGCVLPDFHEGLCSTAEVLGKRPRVLIQQPPPPRPSIRARCRSNRPAPMPTALEPPAQQRVLPNGLHRFYHGQRWGVPLPEGPVEREANSDDEADEGWRLRQIEQRIRARANVSEGEAAFMGMWNRHMHTWPPTVSDRMLPETCRHFASQNVTVLADTLQEVRAACHHL